MTVAQSRCITQLTRDLDQCHVQMKHLNQMLSEKKEDILTYQDQIANMRAELAELRDTSMDHVRVERGRGELTELRDTTMDHVWWEGVKNELSQISLSSHWQRSVTRRILLYKYNPSTSVTSFSFSPQSLKGHHGGTEAEYALQVQVEQLSRRTRDLQQQLDKQRIHYEQRLEKERERGAGGLGGGDGRGTMYQNYGGDHSELQNLCQQVRTLLL